MTYTLLPNSGQSLGQTRSDIRTNFSLIQTAQDTNHVAIDGSGAGKHKFLQMPEQGSAPATAADEAGFYAKVGTTPAQSNLFFRGENSVGGPPGGFEYQLTRAISASTASFGNITTALPSSNGFGGWTFLPGNLLMQFGTFNPNTSITVEFPIPFNATPFSIQLTGSFDNSTAFRVGVSTGTVTSSQFVFEGSVTSHANPIYFVAIGV